MRAIMAVSKDGFLARGPFDTMDWLGATDKAVFRILTSCGGKVGVSRCTAALMPYELKGREMFLLAQTTPPGPGNPIFGDLSQFYSAYGAEDSWLIGGPKLVNLALRADFLDEVHMCHSDRYSFADPAEGIRDHITLHLNHYEDWDVVLETKINDVKVVNWRRTKCPTAS